MAGMDSSADAPTKPRAGGGHYSSGAPGGRGAASTPLDECMRLRGIEEAWNMMEEMQIQGLPITRFPISRLLMKTAAGEGGASGSMNVALVHRGIHLVERFIGAHPEEADEVLFNALLDTCFRARDMRRLEATVRRMEELQVEPSHVTLGILVKAYGRAGDATRVMNLWERMEEQRSQANAVTYGCMIDACVKCGCVGKALEIFQDMKRMKKHRNTILYTTLIKGYGLEKDLRRALALFREMKAERVPYNRIAYNSIIDVCIKCSDVQAAENLMAEMTAPGSRVEPDLITFSTLLKGYCHIADLDKALQVAQSIKAQGLKCDELVYNTLMDGCVRANDLSAGIGLFSEMTMQGMKPSSITHNILVRMYQKGGFPDPYSAVAELYQQHGLPRPTVGAERRGNRGSGRKSRNQQPARFGPEGQQSCRSMPRPAQQQPGVSGRYPQPMQPGQVVGRPHNFAQPPPGVFWGCDTMATAHKSLGLMQAALSLQQNSIHVASTATPPAMQEASRMSAATQCALPPYPSLLLTAARGMIPTGMPTAPGNVGYHFPAGASLYSGGTAWTM